MRSVALAKYLMLYVCTNAMLMSLTVKCIYIINKVQIYTIYHALIFCLSVPMCTQSPCLMGFFFLNFACALVVKQNTKIVAFTIELKDLTFTQMQTTREIDLCTMYLGINSNEATFIPWRTISLKIKCFILIGLEWTAFFCAIVLVYYINNVIYRDTQHLRILDYLALSSPLFNFLCTFQNVHFRFFFLPLIHCTLSPQVFSQPFSFCEMVLLYNTLV